MSKKRSSETAEASRIKKTDLLTSDDREGQNIDRAIRDGKPYDQKATAVRAEMAEGLFRLRESRREKRRGELRKMGWDPDGWVRVFDEETKEWGETISIGQFNPKKLLKMIESGEATLVKGS